GAENLIIKNEFDQKDDDENREVNSSVKSDVNSINHECQK
ncbi:unnamed protein product, partial [Brachionus calyciflorus]